MGHFPLEGRQSADAATAARARGSTREMPVDQKPAGMSAHLGKRGVAKGFSLEAGRKRRRRAQHPVTDGLQSGGRAARW